MRHSPKGARHGTFFERIKTMDDLLLHGLKDIYYAENQIVKSLSTLIKKTTCQSGEFFLVALSAILGRNRSTWTLLRSCIPADRMPLRSSLERLHCLGALRSPWDCLGAPFPQPLRSPGPHHRGSRALSGALGSLRGRQRLEAIVLWRQQWCSGIERGGLVVSCMSASAFLRRNASATGVRRWST